MADALPGLRRALIALAGVAILAVPAAGQEAPWATVELPDQSTDGGALLVDHVQSSHGGFVVIYGHDPGPEFRDASVIGISPPFGAGYQTDLVVTLHPRLQHGQSVVAVVHQDTNGNQVFEHDRDRSKDPPYRTDGSAVTDRANVRLLSRDEPEVAGWTAPLVGGLGGALVGVGLAWWHRARVK